MGLNFFFNEIAKYKNKILTVFFIDNILQNITKSIKLKLIFLYNKLWLLVDLVNILLSF